MQGITYQISTDAEEELDGIYAYSLLNHGLRQADEYLASLYSCFEMLATHPHAGTEVAEVLKGAWRHPHEKHVIYYEPSKPVLVLRVLGEKQDPLTQFMNA